MSALLLVSPSRATDKAWTAAADVAAVAAELGIGYRLVGGLAVTLLTHHHGVEARVPSRETSDADMAVPRDVCADTGLADALAGRGYGPVRRDGDLLGNEFTKGRDDPPITVEVLTVSWSGRREVAAGPIAADAFPGIHTALMLPATTVDVAAELTDGTHLKMSVAVPDVRAALVLKAYAYRDRFADRDAVDVWRLLEAAHAASHTATSWPTTSGSREAAQILREFFAAPNATGPTRASARRADQERVRALALRVVPDA
ncbi:hypothetical protein [Actinotalea solisilvae]|uniref:hypothetical protein n=1 Tax=Actinotalea solisilvae TaxID=2072922 RepID=UPI0018F16CA7|nr:hypothetical protein [Actinotalea solisilvae]